MADRNRTTPHRDRKLTDIRPDGVSVIPREKFRFDELVASLAAARENRRARQVVKWESMARNNFSLYV